MTAERAMRRWTLALLALVIAGCAVGPRRLGLGEEATVGVFSYRVISAQWEDRIGRGTSMVVPDSRFLVVYLTLTNIGKAPRPFPRARLVDAAGREYPESAKAHEHGIGLESLQAPSPGFTLNGSLVFDVPPGAYTLILSDGDHGEAAIVLPH